MASYNWRLRVRRHDRELPVATASYRRDRVQQQQFIQYSHIYTWYYLCNKSGLR